MSRMVITVDADDVSDLNALYYALKVVQQGRVSESKNGPCYCFVTTFKNGVRVCAERTKNGTDTFRVGK